MQVNKHARKLIPQPSVFEIKDKGLFPFKAFSGSSGATVSALQRCGAYELSAQAGPTQHER